MVSVFSKENGFEVAGKIELFETDAKKPPKENPYGYDIDFTMYEEDQWLQSIVFIKLYFAKYG